MKRGVVDGKRLEDVVEPLLHPSEVSQLRVQVRGFNIQHRYLTVQPTIILDCSDNWNV